MHLFILTQYYPPEIGAPQARLSELAKLFTSSRHSVTVLTAMPNYPTGKIHAGYGGLLRRENRNGVEIIRSFIFPTQRTDLPHRLLNYLSFVLSSAVLGLITLRTADFLMVESPPLFLGFASVWLNRIKRIRMIFNVSDLWPESVVRLGAMRRNSLAHRLTCWLEAFCYQHAWLVTGQSKSILADIHQRFPTLPTFHLSNGVDTSKFGPEQATLAARSVLGGEPGFVLVYAGLHGLAQGLEQLIEAATRLSALPQFHFVLIGDGPEKQRLQALAQARYLTNIRFLDPRPNQEIPALLAAADAVVVPLKLYLPGAVPSKLYEAMASARPVILVASGEAADIVREHEAGIVVEPGNVAGLVKALETLQSQPELRQRFGQNGRAAVEECFDRAKIIGRFIAHLEANLAT